MGFTGTSRQDGLLSPFTNSVSAGCRLTVSSVRAPSPLKALPPPGINGPAAGSPSSLYGCSHCPMVSRSTEGHVPPPGPCPLHSQRWFPPCHLSIHSPTISQNCTPYRIVIPSVFFFNYHSPSFQLPRLLTSTPSTEPGSFPENTDPSSPFPCQV